MSMWAIFIYLGWTLIVILRAIILCRLCEYMTNRRSKDKEYSHESRRQIAEWNKGGETRWLKTLRRVIACMCPYQVNFHPIFNHPWKYFITTCSQRECRVLASAWTHPSSMTIFVHLFIRSVIRKVTIVTLNTILTKYSMKYNFTNIYYIWIQQRNKNRIL